MHVVKMIEMNPKVACTLYNTILRIARNFLETRENIKISTHPFYHINLGWFSWEWSKIFFFFFEKKIQNGRLKKSSFSSSANSQYFLAKISWIGSLISKNTNNALFAMITINNPCEEGFRQTEFNPWPFIFFTPYFSVNCFAVIVAMIPISARHTS